MHIADSAESLTSFPAKKEERFSDDIQFLEAQIASAKQEYTQLQQQAGDYERRPANEQRLAWIVIWLGIKRDIVKIRLVLGLASAASNVNTPRSKLILPSYKAS